MNKAQETRTDIAVSLMVTGICFVAAGLMAGMLIVLIVAGQDMSIWEANADFVPYSLAIAVVAVGVVGGAAACWQAVGWVVQEMGR